MLIRHVKWGTVAGREGAMSEPRMVSCYSYVNRPFEGVVAILRKEPLELLQRATTSAKSRARSLATTLRVEVGAFAIGVDVKLCVRRVVEESEPGAIPKLRLQLTWEAMDKPGLFPSMLADLVVWPPSPGGTQIEVQGGYWVPLGPIGAAFDAAIGHRIAEASVHGFLNDVIDQLLAELPPPA